LSGPLPASEALAALEFPSHRPMARLVRRHDWASTPLGPLQRWPPQLRALVGVMLAAGQPMFMAWGPQRTWLYNDAFIPILGVKHPHALGRPALAEVWSEAEGVLTPMFDRVFAGEHVTMDAFSLLLDRGDGLKEAHFSFSYTPARDETGAVAGLFGVCSETTALILGDRQRQAAEEQRLLLLNELNHRVKNTLAVVQGIARQSFRDAEARASLEVFEARLAALSRAHNLLTDADWKAANLRDIVLDQLAQAGARVQATGPSVMLAPQIAVSLALALHELGANATKYGALSNDGGRVEISWRVDPDPPTLRLRWEEAGGPTVQPPGRRGFGSRMIERALAAELGGVVRIDYPPTGVVCEIHASLTAGLAPSDAAI
jgi:two-component sensor histidine kinase